MIDALVRPLAVLNIFLDRICYNSVFAFQPRVSSSMPPNFSSIYTPVTDAGTHNQIGHVARLLAAQMVNAGIGPGVEQTGYNPKKVNKIKF